MTEEGLGVASASPPQPEAGVAATPSGLQWDGYFKVNDPDPADDHGPIYLQCPDGLLVNFSCHATPGVDAARVTWVVETLNAALPFDGADSEVADYGDLLDVIESAIDDSMDYDWRYRDGAKAVAAALVGANAIRFSGGGDLLKALKRLTVAARTSGGVAGADAEMMAACADAEAAIAKAEGRS